MDEARRPLAVITRPRADAEALAARVERAGFAALVEPLLEIRPTVAAMPPLDGYAALAFTSANAVRAFAVRAAAREMPAYAVGATTAAALRAAGFTTVRARGPDVAGMAREIARDLPPRARVLYPSGKAVARALDSLLPGIRVDRLVVYDAVPAHALSPSLVDALYARTVHSVLLFSARTAATFAALVSEVELAGSCRYIKALCLSDAVAAGAASLPWRSIAVAARPTEEALLALLPDG